MQYLLTEVVAGINLNTWTGLPRCRVPSAAALLDLSVEQVCRQAGIPVLLDSSVKRGLDVEWSDPLQKAKALRTLVEQVESLQQWVEVELRDQAQGPPLRELLGTLRQLMRGFQKTDWPTSTSTAPQPH